MRIGIIIAILFWALIIYAIDKATSREVYMCSEVTKDSPPDVQQICKRAWKRQ